MKLEQTEHLYENKSQLLSTSFTKFDSGWIIDLMYSQKYETFGKNKKNRKINLCDLELAKDFLKNIIKEKTDTLEFF